MRRARRGREQDFAEISRRIYEEIRSSRDPRDHVWKRRLVLVPHREDDPAASRRPHPQRTLHKDRTGGDLFLFTHLTVEVPVFIYLL